jgi:hypothetical protein
MFRLQPTNIAGDCRIFVMVQEVGRKKLRFEALPPAAQAGYTAATMAHFAR